MSVAGISTVGFEDRRTQGAMRGANPDNFTVILSGHSMRPPLRTIYIHTVAKRSTSPLTRTLFPKLTLRGCENGERFVTCAVIGDPIGQAVKNEMTGGTDIKDNDGWRAAIDLLNVSNITNDPYSGSSNPDFFANRNGNNWIAEGFWPSLNEIPDDAEIRRAEKCRDQRYQWLARESRRLASRSKKDLDEFLQTYPETFTALDSLGIKTDFHSPATVSATCPNCGDDIKPGLAFHKSSVTDRLCVIDPEKAWKAKAITKEEYEELVTAPAPPKRGTK